MFKGQNNIMVEELEKSIKTVHEKHEHIDKLMKTKTRNKMEILDLESITSKIKIC